MRGKLIEDSVRVDRLGGIALELWKGPLPQRQGSAIVSPIRTVEPGLADERQGAIGERGVSRGGHGGMRRGM